MKRYYEAYEERYKTVHREGLSWFSDNETGLIPAVMQKYGIAKETGILEIGCGEGRDAAALLRNGYSVRASDVSPAAVKYCQRRFPEFADSFFELDCVNGKLDESFDFIYAVAVLHMLVDDDDRNSFYSFIRDHLNIGGIALIMSMGNGEDEFSTDPNEAFELRERMHDGKKLMVPATTCRVVSFKTLEKEITEAGLELLEKGVTSIENEFDSIMYAVVKA
ncbi:MAG: class I SAM-dependent methyltransferase [Clostridiales bacterium]|nr:class I SAM-dependent methyltransferase [Clostridiales bacterium]